MPDRRTPSAWLRPIGDANVAGMAPPEPRIPLAAIDGMLIAALRPHLDNKTTPPDMRWRLKQLQRQDWPATIVEDPHLKRGYTIRQALRILAAMALLDAGFGPTPAVTLARNNENAILAMIFAATGDCKADGRRQTRYGVIRPATLTSPGAPPADVIMPRSRDSIVRDVDDLASGRAILVIDFGGIGERALDTFRSNGPVDALDQLDAVLTAAVRELGAGRGHVRHDAEAGDRYASPRRMRSDTTSGGA